MTPVYACTYTLSRRGFPVILSPIAPGGYALLQTLPVSPSDGPETPGPRSVVPTRSTGSWGLHGLLRRWYGEGIWY